MFAQSLVAALRAREKEVWVDWEDIEPSADWWLRIEKGIESATAFVVVLSPDQLNSEACRRELATATAGGKRVIPVLRRELDGSQLPEALARPQWISAEEGDNPADVVDRLVAAIDTDLAWLDEHPHPHALTILTVTDEHTRDALATPAARKMGADDTVTVLEQIVERRGRVSFPRFSGQPSAWSESRPVMKEERYATEVSEAVPAGVPA